jgi:ATP-dependent RNA helicase DeaD
LVRLLEREKPKQTIIFCRTKRGADKLYRRLKKHIGSVETMHGDMAQSARDRTMSRFRSGDLTLLVATDIVGRGIDVTSVSHIINYDLPQFSDDYVHRVGRTGRMGREGVAYSFVLPEEGKELTRIEERINRLLKRDEMADFDAIGPGEPEEPHHVPSLVARRPSDGEPESAAPGAPPPPPFSKRSVKKYRRAL